MQLEHQEEKKSRYSDSDSEGGSQEDRDLQKALEESLVSNDGEDEGDEDDEDNSADETENEVPHGPPPNGMMSRKGVRVMNVGVEVKAEGDEDEGKMRDDAREEKRDGAELKGELEFTKAELASEKAKREVAEENVAAKDEELKGLGTALRGRGKGWAPAMVLVPVCVHVVDGLATGLPRAHRYVSDMKPSLIKLMRSLQVLQRSADERRQDLREEQEALYQEEKGMSRLREDDSMAERKVELECKVAKVRLDQAEVRALRSQVEKLSGPGVERRSR